MQIQRPQDFGCEVQQPLIVGQVQAPLAEPLNAQRNQGLEEFGCVAGRSHDIVVREVVVRLAQTLVLLVTK
ncbi:MAG: hypothetical protein AB1441_04870 [Bacillota bacterium]